VALTQELQINFQELASLALEEEAGSSGQPEVTFALQRTVKKVFDFHYIPIRYHHQPSIFIVVLLFAQHFF
jgi:8-oxo-dGTP pyrophosphatase MutT (NUDIX family)